MVTKSAWAAFVKVGPFMLTGYDTTGASNEKRTGLVPATLDRVTFISLLEPNDEVLHTAVVADDHVVVEQTSFCRKRVGV